MRITDKLLSESMLSNIARAHERMVELQTDLASTKKLRAPSDDPTGFSRTANFNGAIERNEQYLRNIGQASARFTDTLAVLDSAVDILSNARELATRASSDTMEQDSRAALASEARQILESILAAANTEHNGKPIFAGTRTSETPFTLQSDSVAYHGNSGRIRNKIGDDAAVIVNKPGNEVFQSAEGGDVFATLLKLQRGLEENDSDAISNSIDELESGIEHLLTVSAEVGSAQTQLNLTEEMLEARNVDLATFSSRIEDADIVETTIRFQEAQNAYTFALRSYSEVVETSLLNFIS